MQNHMRKTTAALLGLCLALGAFASPALGQRFRAYELGPYLGGAYYMGEVNPGKQFYSMDPAFGAAFRVNFNSWRALRLEITQMSISGSDLDFDNEYQQTRAHQFENELLDFAALYEFNFFPLNPKGGDFWGSPYVALGFGLSVAYDGPQKLNPNLPVALGMKLRLSPRWSFDLEWNLKKTFSDHLDLLEEQDFGPEAGAIWGKQKSYAPTTDWVSTLGARLNLTLYQRKSTCPAYF